MTELSHKARALIERNRSSLRPTDSDRKRIEAALQARLGSHAFSELETNTDAATSVSWQMLASAGVGLLLLGAIGWQVLTPEPSRPALRSTSFALPASLEDASEDATVLDPEPTPPAELPIGYAPPPESKSLTKAPPPKAQDRLALEVELLSRATRALRSGQPAEALTTLDEHQRKFPKGALRQERSVARAQALCSLGRLIEGRAELERLPKNAPATARAMKACDL
jgi:hypothetical protein